jgi:DNA-binding CsgD family transcriptional regulator
VPSSALRLRDLRAIYELVHECRDLGDDPGEWHRHYFARLAPLIAADLVVGGELTVTPEGGHRGLGATEWGWEHGFDRRGWVRACEMLQADPKYSVVGCEYFRHLTRQDGVALRRTELVAEPVWDRSPEWQEVYRTIGTSYSIYCFRFIPGRPTEVIGSILTRAIGEPDFNSRQLEIVREAQAQVGALVGGALARYTEPSPSDLPRRVREVLRCLLEGDSDKQIATRLGISKYTVNQYVKTIFAHFGVTTRTELLARWIRRGWGNGFAWAADAPE